MECEKKDSFSEKRKSVIYYSKSYSFKKFAISNSPFPPNSTLETFLKCNFTAALHMRVYPASQLDTVSQKEEMV